MSHRYCPKFLVSLALAFNLSTLFAQAPAVQVEVYDYTHMALGSVHKVIELTQEILAGAGLSIRFIICRPTPEGSCETESGTSRRLVIRLVPVEPKTMNNVLRPPLGWSIAGPEGGTYASIFLPRVKDAAAEANVPWDVVFAYATAHEVGHLLLGVNAHTARGLMKATWGRAEYEAMYQRQLHFSDEQSRQLASRYGSPPQTNIGTDTEPR